MIYEVFVCAGSAFLVWFKNNLMNLQLNQQDCDNIKNFVLSVVSGLLEQLEHENIKYFLLKLFIKCQWSISDSMEPRL